MPARFMSQQLPLAVGQPMPFSQTNQTMAISQLQLPNPGFGVPHTQNTVSPWHSVKQENNTVLIFI